MSFLCYQNPLAKHNIIFFLLLLDFSNNIGIIL